MKKNDAFYFENLLAVSKICVNAADYLVEFLTNYDASRIAESMRTMHEFEHSADKMRHEMNNTLSKAFITPIDRDDLASLSQNLDDVADCIEEVLQAFCMDEPASVTQESILIAKKISDCCKAMESMFAELHNFKKPERLRAAIIQINDIEEECDRIYLDAYKAVRTPDRDVLDIIFWRRVYDQLECCADACEHVSDVVSLVIMKNS